MEKPIVSIENASEETIQFLLKIGVLRKDESGFHVVKSEKEKQ